VNPGEAVVAAARSVIGDPYVWGATGPGAFDCSGLVVWSYEQIGMTLPRTSYDQAVGGRPVSRNELEPGDVIIYYPDASHCALYSGNGNVIEASTYGVPVKEVPVDYAGPYNTARRYLQPTPGDPVTLFYPDVSNNNWGNENLTAAGQQNLYNFLAQLAAQGFAGVCHKMSQGGGGNAYIDPYGALCQTWCAQNNFPFIGYHWVSTDDPASQAAAWLAAGGGVNVMFDVEAGPPSSGDINNFWAVANAFNAAGVNVQLAYLPQWYWGQIGSPDLSALASAGILLVSSGYPTGASDFAFNLYYNDGGGDNGEGWVSYGGATPAAWQFTSNAAVSGFTGVDVNAYQGADIGTLFGTSAPAPPPPPPPGPVYATGDKPADLATQVSQIYDQLLIVWPQLGNRSLVDAIAQVLKGQA
jgi:hypothetical protein